MASNLGDGIVSVALAFAVLDLTGSATDLGIVLAARTVAQEANALRTIAGSGVGLLGPALAGGSARRDDRPIMGHDPRRRELSDQRSAALRDRTDPRDTEARHIRGDGGGRHERFTLTNNGTQRLAGATAAVAAIEEKMLAPFDSDQRRRLRADLATCAEALSVSSPDRQA